MRENISTLFVFLKKKRKTIYGVLFLLVLMLAATGCSRAQINEQVAESIGTLGMYENNEPVETPKMKSTREMRESKDAIESDVTGHLEIAAEYAACYDYEKALDEIAQIEEEYQDDERVISTKVEYQRLQSKMVYYNSNITHFSVKTLIADPSRAFDHDEMSYDYNNWNLTVGEFQKILQSLYDRGYILMDIYDTVVEYENEDGTVSFALNHPLVPEGKTPIILSFTEANYYGFEAEDGFATRMVLDEDGNVQCEYKDAKGNKLVGAYDVVPVLNEFIEEHPDFSLRGARGIISVTGYKGVFGYGIETGASTIQAIAEKLRADGWRIACNGYSNELYESVLDYNKMAYDMEDWEEKVGKYVLPEGAIYDHDEGLDEKDVDEKEFDDEEDSDEENPDEIVSDHNGQEDLTSVNDDIECYAKLLIYPYGDEVSTGTMKHKWLLDAGYRFFFSIWTTSDYLEVNSGYVRQTRRILDGYDIYAYGDSLTQFFDPKAILDPLRPPFE